MMTVHVTPVGDLDEHFDDGPCRCAPRIEASTCGDGSRARIVVHNSFDGREVNE